MKRRNFIKLSMATWSSLLLPSYAFSKELNLDEINLSSSVYNSNNAQTIVVFLYGGASELAGNLTNLAQIKPLSQSSYDSYFGTITPTANNCWQEAGGSYMEELMNSGDMTLFRTCFSQVRDANNNKAHGSCVHQNQTGSFDEDNAGIITNLAQILEGNNLIDENTFMPFVTLEGDSKFYLEGNVPLSTYLKPIALSANLSNNPYTRSHLRSYRYYNRAERSISDYSSSTLGFNASLHDKMDQLAQQQNRAGKIKNVFSKRAPLADFFEQMSNAAVPNLGADAYPNNGFADKMKTAIKVLTHNPDTKIVTLGTSGLGGWDNHDQARSYVARMESVFRTLKSAVAHIKAEGKIDTINIMVFGEFGRNVNLNNGNGWDHGNLQNLYVLGGKGYFNHKGVVGETRVEDLGGVNRLFLKPQNGSYEFEPLSIAATIYSLYGITNPEVLTNGNGIISELL